MSLARPLDYLLAFAGWCLVLGGVVFALSAAFLPPDPSSTLPVFAAVAVLAAPLSWWYLRTGRSLGDLGTFYFAVAACETTLAFALYATIRLADFPSIGRYSPAGLSVVAVVYAAAYWLVYRDGWARLRGRAA